MLLNHPDQGLREDVNRYRLIAIDTFSREMNVNCIWFYHFAIQN